MIKLNIVPKPKPRMTLYGARMGKYQKYWDWKNELQKAAANADFELGEAFRVIFIIPLLKKWQTEDEKAKYRGMPHKRKPDRNNLTKALEDCLLDEDSHIWWSEEAKFWGDEGSIYIQNLTKEDIELEMALGRVMSDGCGGCG